MVDDYGNPVNEYGVDSGYTSGIPTEDSLIETLLVKNLYETLFVISNYLMFGYGLYIVV